MLKKKIEGCGEWISWPYSVSLNESLIQILNEHLKEGGDGKLMGGKCYFKSFAFAFVFGPKLL